ncbi:2OG-Fe(II) oxygenase [Pedobacter suwonensis]|uniref:2OG-Fe(II) oxygenase n=1 Tax=Pedobacter suwonensis TaxID=332999 RepID=UPI00119CA97D|nr:2OG-Fe(II) oxygenase [Pedobacter suwonensis]
MGFLNAKTDLLQWAKANKAAYQRALPFPNIVFTDFFDEEMLNHVLREFPDLAKAKEVQHYDNHNEKKYQAKGEAVFGDTMRQLMHYLNSQPMLEFLQELTGIKEVLLPDPYFVGGGCHEIKPGGLLKVHADFNKHELTGLDRRINLLIYLNKDWEESFGGHFELWNQEMTQAEKRVLPVFNTVAIFSTTSFAYHGHPNPLTCPPGRSRKSLALYYYTNGRPAEEVNPDIKAHSTIFVGRKDIADDVKKIKRPFKTILLDYIPPIVVKLIKKTR